MALTFPKHTYLHYSPHVPCKSIVMNLRCCCPFETMATHRLRSKYCEQNSQNLTFFSLFNDGYTSREKTHQRQKIWTCSEVGGFHNPGHSSHSTQSTEVTVQQSYCTPAGASGRNLWMFSASHDGLHLSINDGKGFQSIWKF